MDFDYENMILMEKFPCQKNTWGYKTRFEHQKPVIPVETPEGKAYVSAPEMTPLKGYNALKNGSVVKEDDVVFVGAYMETPIKNLEKFFQEILPEIDCRFNLAIVENSDFGDYEKFSSRIEGCDKIINFYFPSGNPSVFPRKGKYIPFGISVYTIKRGYMHKHGHLPLKMAMREKALKENHTKMMLAKFSVNTNPEREKLLRMAKGWRFCEVIPPDNVNYNGSNGFQEKYEYFSMNTDYKFVLCPAGEDSKKNFWGTSARIWESIYLGCVPVIKKTPSSILFDDLPVLVVDDWSEVSEDLLKKTWESFQQRVFEKEKMTLSYWIDKMRNGET